MPAPATWIKIESGMDRRRMLVLSPGRARKRKRPALAGRFLVARSDSTAFALACNGKAKQTESDQCDRAGFRNVGPVVPANVPKVIVEFR